MLYNLQYLRGMAAIFVLLFHVSERYSLPFKIGAIGVDIFFVISGFIMWATTSGKQWTPRDFLVRRIVRIVPIYWIATFATAVAIALKPQFFFHNNLSIGNLIGSLFFVPDVRDNAFHPVVIQGWTLVYEMFFYICFAIFLFFSESIRAWLISIFLIFIVSIHSFFPDGTVKTLGDPILLEFVSGLILGWLWTKKVSCPVWLGVVLLVFGTIYLSIIDTIIPEWPRLVRWGLPSLMIVSGAVFVETMRYASYSYFLKLLGDASYSIYIWHGLLLILLDAIIMKFNLPLAIHFPLLVISAISMLVFLYFSIEKPINDFLRRSILADKARLRAGGPVKA